MTNLITGDKIMVGDLAGCCQSRATRVLARQLDVRVKLFSKWDDQNYLYGRPGDWLVQRRENPSDLYIVTEPLFNLTYELQ